MLTLLKNRDGRGAPTAPGEEYTPPGYRTVPLTAGLARVRAAIFGAAPDDRMLAYRLRQVLACLHATELDGHARAFDPRITYLPWDDFAFPAEVVLDSASAAPLYLGGEPPAADPAGRLVYSWLVAATPAPPGAAPIITPGRPVGRLTPFFWPVAIGPYVPPEPTATAAVVRRLRPDYLEQAVDLSYAAGLSSVVPLPGSGLTARFPALDAPAGWVVTATCRPDGLAAVLGRLETVGEPALLELFGLGPEEPGVTWKNLWESTQPLPYRLGAAALALAARTDAIRLRNNP